MKKLIGLITVILLCFIFLAPASKAKEKLPRLHLIDFYQIGDIEIEVWREEGTRNLWYEAWNNGSKINSSNTNFPQHNETEKTKTTLHLLIEKAESTKTIRDIVVAIEEAKKPKYWTSDIPIGEMEVQILFLAVKHIPNSYDIFTGWIDFITTLKNTLSLMSELDSFSKYIENTEPERKEDYKLYVKNLFENKENWASNNAIINTSNPLD